MSVLLNWLTKNLFKTLLFVGIGGIVIVREIARVLFQDSLLVASFISIFICFVCLLIYYQILDYSLVKGSRGDVSPQSPVGRIIYSFLGKESPEKLKTHNPDNLYYMGLLFTLASLVYSLVTLFLFNVNEGELTERVYNLVGSFGIALISTFLGILFRILLLQEFDSTSEQAKLRQDGDEIERQRKIAHEDLIESARKLRQELTQTIADMANFRQTIVQATYADMDTFRQTIAQARDKAIEDVDKVRVTIIQQMEKATQEQTKRMQDSIVLARQSAEQLEDSTRQALAKIADSGKKTGDAFASVLESLQTVINELQSTTQNTQTFASKYDALNSEIRRSVTLFTDTGSEMEKATKALTAEISAFAASIAEAAKITPNYHQEYEQLIKALRQEAEQWQSMTEEVRTSLVQAIEALTQAVDRR